MELTKDTVKKGQGWDPDLNCTYNEDGTVTIVRNVEIGIQLPKSVYSEHKFSKAIISYKDSTNAGKKFGYVVKYDSDSTSWGSGEENQSGWDMLSGEGTAEIVPKDTEKNFSGIRLFDGDENASITITSIVFVK